MNTLTTQDDEVISPINPPSRNARRWGALPMGLDFTGSPQEAFARLPRFERIRSEDLGLGVNESSDLVVRTNGIDNVIERPTPISFVSKSYRLIQHSEFLTSALNIAGQLPKAKINSVEVFLTSNGERAMFRIGLGDAFSFGPDGQEVGLQMLCKNSVDGGVAASARLGWFRFVCANGMIVGLEMGRTRLTHTPTAHLGNLFEPLIRQVQIASDDQSTMHRWAKARVKSEALRKWVDTDVAEAWNGLAASRVWSICTSGRDASCYLPPFKKDIPTRRQVKRAQAVPGSPAKAETLYAVAQALSWVASRRSDQDECESFQRGIGPLMAKVEEL